MPENACLLNMCNGTAEQTISLAYNKYLAYPELIPSSDINGTTVPISSSNGILSGQVNRLILAAQYVVPSVPLSNPVSEFCEKIQIKTRIKI